MVSLSILLLLSVAAGAATAQYRDLKCWKNKVPQFGVRLEGRDPRLAGNYKKRKDPVNKCYEVARDGGYDFFAVGNKGQCWAGHGEDYKQYKQVKNCPKHGKGRYGVVHVYQIEVHTTREVTTTPELTTIPYDHHNHHNGYLDPHDPYFGYYGGPWPTTTERETTIRPTTTEEEIMTTTPYPEETTTVIGDTWEDLFGHTTTPEEIMTTTPYPTTPEEIMTTTPYPTTPEIIYDSYEDIHGHPETTAPPPTTIPPTTPEIIYDSYEDIHGHPETTEEIMTTPPYPTTPETVKCGWAGKCNVATEYCFHHITCKSLEKKGSHCVTDKECQSKNCKWSWKYGTCA